VKLGIFMPTMNGGWVVSNNVPELMPDWFLIESTAKKAEHYDFDFLLAPVKLRGFDGTTEFWNHTLDSMTAMAGVAVVTKNIKLYASIATLTTPPPLAAKQAATIHDMSGGRFGLNIVTGWEKGEYTQMGIWPGDQHFENRYDHADEYVTIMKELWETGRSDFKGKFFEMDDCMLGPKPKSKIELVCAGQSARGMRFTAEHADYLFVTGKAEVEDLQRHNAPLIEAGSKTGRKVGSWPVYAVVQRDTREEALEAVEHWRDGVDQEAMATMMGYAAGDTSNTDENATKNIMLGREGFMFSFGVLAGNGREIAEQIQALSEVEGTDGVMFTFQDYLTDLDRFGRDVVPLLRKSGKGAANQVAAIAGS
jgi:pyrimidine oxygenase